MHDIEYVELYTEDGVAAVDYFVTCLGYAEAARCHDDAGGRTSTLLHQGSSQIIVTHGLAAGAFLDKHGDGIADIAFACEDVAAAVNQAVTAGAEPTRGPGAGHVTTVSGFGDVRHTLVERPPGAPRLLPPGWDWQPAAAGPGSVERIADVDHVAVVVPGGSLHDVADFYDAAFGLAPFFSEYISVGEQGMNSIAVRSRSEAVTFTIMEPDLTRRPGQIDDFLNANAGAGVQHLAFRTADIVSAVRAYARQGVEFLRTPASYYELLSKRVPSMASKVSELQAMNVLADSDESGYLLQLFTRSPYKKCTLFYELVERGGAQGFGTANIQALYEAVERNQAANAAR